MPRRRRRRHVPRRPLTVAALLATTVVGGAVVARRRGHLAAIPGLDRLPPVPGLDRLPSVPGLDRLPSVPGLDRLPGPFRSSSQPGHEDWSCACGAQYRMTGRDRHRVYWPAGAAEDEPVLGTDCVQCGRPLPA